MGDKKGKKASGKKGDKKGGGFGKFIALTLLLAGGGGAAFYALAPDQFLAQVDHVKSMMGG